MRVQRGSREQRVVSISVSENESKAKLSRIVYVVKPT